MSAATEPGGESQRTAQFVSRLPTGTRLFLILSAALLPLALIAVFASLQTGRTADQEVAARLRVATQEAARALSIELMGDMNAMRVSLIALGDDGSNAASCARLHGAFVSQQSRGARFRIVDRAGKTLCGDDDMPAHPITMPTTPDAVGVALLPGQGLILTITDSNSGAHGTAYFPSDMLSELVRPDSYLPSFSATIDRAGERLDLRTIPNLGPLSRTESAVAPLLIDQVKLVMRVRSAPITSSMLLAMILPLLMWAAAASIGWLVVDRLLIRPLRRLRTAISGYQPGELMPPVRYGAVPAQEIRALDDTFRELTHTVRLHEADLAEGLVRQTKLTREVHHRVKNNLQVIASLINLHSRGADPAAVDAYASIQRRVDALAVVHRHHYAEMEVNRGLSLRSVIGELASNLRATAPEASARMGITLDLDLLYSNQDVAVALAFLITELVELAIMVSPVSQIGISARTVEDAQGFALLRITTPSLADSPRLQALLAERYGRVILGLSRQLRAPLHHDPLVGAYEIRFAAEAE